MGRGWGNAGLHAYTHKQHDRGRLTRHRATGDCEEGEGRQHEGMRLRTGGIIRDGDVSADEERAGPTMPRLHGVFAE